MKKELIDLLFRGSESKGFDYKRAESWKKCKFKLTKDILAMTNIQDGGTLIIGVSQQDTNEFEYTGFKNPEDLKDYDVTKIADFVNKYANPEVNIEVIIDEYEGEKYVFIIVKEFKNVPVICKRNSSNEELKISQIYIRTDSAKSVPIRSQEIDSVAEMRGLIDLALAKQGEELLSKIRKIVLFSLPKKKPKTSAYINEKKKIEEDF